MSDEIYINTGTTIQQPYQGQVVKNAQEPNTRDIQQPYIANSQTPFTYQNRSPFTYQNIVRHKNLILEQNSLRLPMQDKVELRSPINILLPMQDKVKHLLHIRCRVLLLTGTLFLPNNLILETNNNRILILQMPNNLILEINKFRHLLMHRIRTHTFIR